MTADPPRSAQTVFDTGLRVPWATYRFKLLHPLLARFGRFLLQGRARRRYFVMPGDYVSDYTTRFGSFEAEEIAVARQVCRHIFGAERLAHGTLVDVGCHIGNYSVELGPDFGAVLAVDAVQTYAHITRANLAWNGLAERSVVVCAAISDRAGTVRLQMERYGNLGHARVQDDESQDAGPLSTVQATTLDALIERQGLSGVTFIKLDIEGHEIQALRGAAQTIARHAPVIQVEVDKEHLPAVLAGLAATGIGYEAWQVLRGDPSCRNLAERLWRALRAGGNPVFVRRLAENHLNARHLPCVLLIPSRSAIDWAALVPIPGPSHDEQTDHADAPA